MKLFLKLSRKLRTKFIYSLAVQIKTLFIVSSYCKEYPMYLEKTYSGQINLFIDNIQILTIRDDYDGGPWIQWYLKSNSAKRDLKKLINKIFYETFFDWKKQKDKREKLIILYPSKFQNIIDLLKNNYVV